MVLKLQYVQMKKEILLLFFKNNSFQVHAHIQLFNQFLIDLQLVYTDNTVKHALGVSPQFFFIWTWVLNHNKYIEIKQFSKVDIKQNNLLIW